MTLENQSYKGGNVCSFFIVSKFDDISNCITIGNWDLITGKHVWDLIHNSNKLWVNLLSSMYLNGGSYFRCHRDFGCLLCL
jgi:hypothetical protein